MSSIKNIDALIFDMDGLLIDSEPFWEKVETSVFEKHGLVLTPEMCAETKGFRVSEVVAHWARRRPSLEPHAKDIEAAIVSGVADQIETRGEALPGALDLIRAAKHDGFKLAICSSSPRRLIDAVVHRFQLENCFDIVHSAETDTLGKPHPQPYLSTVEKLGVNPDRVIVFEDSVTGVVSAKAAKLKVVCVPSDRPAPTENFQVPDILVPSLIDIKVKSGQVEAFWQKTLSEVSLFSTSSQSTLESEVREFSNKEVEATLKKVALSNGFNAWLNLDLIAAGDGQCEIALNITDEMRQHHGFAHGGIVGALADTVTSWAAASIAGDVVTSSYTLQLMGAAKHDRLVATGSVIKKGPSNVTVEGRVFTVSPDQQKKLIAVSLAAIAVVRREPA